MLRKPRKCKNIGGCILNDKEKLYYLIKEFIKGNYKANVFCDEFTIQYDIETDYSTLSNEENHYFSELSNITTRFSDDTEDLKTPNLYFDEKQVNAKANQVAKKLNIIIG